jgi:hypothetical protein
MQAVAHAQRILDWYQNLTSDEIPPSWMWPFDDLVSEWLDDVLDARRSGTTLDRDETDWDSMDQNELSPRYVAAHS